MVFASVLLRSAAAGVKQTTNLTGLKVAKNPHHQLSVLYNKTLRTLSKMPEDAAYRRYTQQIVNDRLEVVKSEPDVAKLEEKLNNGQVS